MKVVTAAEKQVVNRGELEKQLAWFVKIRWLAVVGVLTAIGVSKFGFEFDLAYGWLLAGNFFMAVYNLFFQFFPARVKSQLKATRWDRLLARLASAQILLDYLMLAFLIHLAGGVENPFVLFFIFHVIISAILLSRFAAYLHSGFGALLLFSVLLAEYEGLLPHYHLEGFVPAKVCLARSLYLLGVAGAFVVTIFFTVYLTTNIVSKLRRREHQLAEANEKLQEKDRMKSRYVMNVSHDLRSAMSTVQNCLKVVLEGMTGEVDSEKSREMISRAEKRTDYMLKYVRDLLQLSVVRMEEKETEEEVDLDEILEGVLDRFQDEARQGEVELNYRSQGPAPVPGYHEDWEQVMNNLVGNAVKYTSGGGRVDVSVEQLNGSFKVEIEDTGIGIPEDQQDEIFEDFYRADNAQEVEEEGTGLGITIVKHIIESVDGEIELESEVGEGTKFILTVPGAIGDE